MSYYFTFLTFSFLATTTLVQAGSNFELGNDWDNKEKLQAKRLRLEEKISSNLTSSTLIKGESSYRMKLLIINNLIEDNPSKLDVKDEKDWQVANTHISEIKKERKNAAISFAAKSNEASILDQELLEKAFSRGENFHLLHKIHGYRSFFGRSSGAIKTLNDAEEYISGIRHLLKQGNGQGITNTFLPIIK